MRMLFAVLLLASLSIAQDPQEKMLKALAAAMKAGRIAAVLDSMPEYVWDEMGDHPETLYEIADLCAQAATAAAGGDATTWNRVTERLESSCGDIADEFDDSAMAHAARGATKLCRCRVNAATGVTFDATLWKAAANEFLAAHKKQAGKGEYLEDAARTLAAAGRIGGDPSLEAQGLELCATGAKSFPRNEYFVARRHFAMLNSILAMSKKKRGEAKRMLKKYLADIEAGKYGTGDLRSTAHTRAVTFAILHKELGVKAKYVTEKVGLGLLTVNIPLGKQWKAKGARIRQYDEDGKLIRTFSTSKYRWDTNYYLGVKKFGGDNIKGLARIGEMDVLTVVTKVTRRRKVRRTKLSKKIRSTVGFEIGGLDEDGDYICYRWFYFQSEKSKLTSIKLSVVDFQEQKKLDPEAAFVVASIREGR